MAKYREVIEGIMERLKDVMESLRILVEHTGGGEGIGDIVVKGGTILVWYGRRVGDLSVGDRRWLGSKGWVFDVDLGCWRKRV